MTDPASAAHSTYRFMRRGLCIHNRYPATGNRQPVSTSDPRHPTPEHSVSGIGRQRLVVYPSVFLSKAGVTRRAFLQAAAAGLAWPRLSDAQPTPSPVTL